MRRFAFAATLALAACQLRPVYEGGPHGVAATTLAEIAVAPIPDRAGYLLRQQLLDRLQPAGTPRYRLEVVLDDHVTGFGIRTDTSIARERRTLRARYRLIDTGSNTVLMDASAGADEGIDVVQSEYAVVAAEQTALERLTVDLSEQIVARVALFARQSHGDLPYAVPGGPALPPPLPPPSQRAGGGGPLSPDAAPTSALPSGGLVPREPEAPPAPPPR